MKHLTSEDLDTLLHDPTAPQPAHLAQCTRCSDELNLLQGTLADLRAATVGISAGPAASRATNVVVMQPRTTPRRAPWYAAAACVAAAAILVPALHRSPSHVDIPAAQPQAVSNQPALSDEALLSSIQSDLSSEVPDAMKPLATVSISSTQTTPRKN